MAFADWYLQNWTWIVPTILGLLATILVGWWGISASRQAKTLDYKIVFAAPLLRRALNWDKLAVELTLQGQLLREPWLMHVKLMNTGQLGISASEYDGAIKLHTKADNYRFTAAVVGQPPSLDMSGVGVAFGPSPEFLLVDPPRLLNAGEALELQLVFEGDPGHTSAEARFKDQTRPVNRFGEPRAHLSVMQWVLLPWMMIVLLGSFVVFILASIVDTPAMFLVWGFVLFGLFRSYSRGGWVYRTFG